MRTIFAKYNPHCNSIDVYASAGYMLRIDCWGFTIVILRVPDIFSDSISALSNFGYEYKISRVPAGG